MKNGFYSAATFPGSTALPFVISTGAPKERSGEICGSQPFLEMFFDRAKRSGEISVWMLFLENGVLAARR
jgi:hypothetical protein